MSKPYTMSQAERTAYRISKNREHERNSLEGIVDQLTAGQLRATYKAVADLLGTNERSPMGRRPRNPRYSWVVASLDGRPTGYTPSQIAPACYQQICSGSKPVIKAPDELRRWLDDASKP